MAAALMLHIVAFYFPGTVLALHLDNSTEKVYLCNQHGTVSCLHLRTLFLLVKIACHILNLADKHSIMLTAVYIPTHLNVEADYLSQGRLAPEWHILPHIAQVAFQLLG